MYAGGQIWIGFVMKIVLNPKRPEGIPLGIEFAESMNKLMVTGFLLLGIGGLIRMYAGNLFSVFADFDTVWGTAFFIKILLYLSLFVTGGYIATKLMPAVTKKAPKNGAPPSKEFEAILMKVEKFSKTDAVIVFTIIFMAIIAMTQ